MLDRLQLALFPKSLFPHPNEQADKPPAPTPSATPLIFQQPATLPANTQWHTTRLNGQELGYLLKRSTRKTVGLSVNDNGLQITAPFWVSPQQLEQVLQKKSAWILSKLKQLKERQALLAVQQIAWQDGDRIPYLGQLIELHRNAVLPEVIFQGSPFAPQEGNILYLPLRPEADSTQMRDLTQSWLQQQARHFFEQRLDYYLDKAALNMKRLRLAAPAKRWGSCSSDGTIMLNWRLIHFPPAIIDYVVAHEVAHLKEMNHSRAFWDFVEFLMPDYHLARAQLRQHDPGTLPLL